MQNYEDKSDLISNSLKTLSIRDLFDSKIILMFDNFVTKNKNSGFIASDQSIENIENYIDTNSSKWIYHSIIKNNPETRYLVLLQHFLDRNPNLKEEIHNLLSSETKFFMKEVEKFFGLGC
ncbi:MAG: hypothetical protein HeimC2_09460 [Candidatus Heimdallarchaeota archaeon LC_2]|nr:MAG: hypothetical protein HeimC2_09460 [Candidatus Heimdallarchaeota archaeon LC_2]